MGKLAVLNTPAGSESVMAPATADASRLGVMTASAGAAAAALASVKARNNRAKSDPKRGVHLVPNAIRKGRQELLGRQELFISMNIIPPLEVSAASWAARRPT
jgi:hypothetical protein